MSFQSLRGRFLFLVLSIYALVGALSVFGFFQLTDSIIGRLGTGYATQYARQQQTRITAKLEREVVLAQKLVTSPLIERWCLDEADPTIKNLALQELESYRELFADKSYFLIVDASKNYYFNNAQDEFRGNELRYIVSREDPESAWYFDAINAVDDFALHVDNSKQLGLTKVWINAVVKQDGKKIGLGGSGLDLTEFLKEVVESPEPGVQTVLVDRQGFLQGHTDAALMQRNAQIKDDSQRLKIGDILPASQEKILEKHLAEIGSAGGSVDHFDLSTEHGREIVGAAALEGIDWVALVFVDPDKVIRTDQFLPILAVIAISLLASIGLVLYTLNRVVLSRLMLLTESTKEIAAGDYEVDLKVDSRDEIGQLTSSFNHMTATIRDHTHNLEQKVEERTEELRHSNLLLEESNQKVMDSIGYALLIQTSLLAKSQELEAVFDDVFVFWRPRDVVGGDYYALYRDDKGGFLMAVADCTGHGVPGAFMSMASKALLDRAVATLGLSDPAALLKEVHSTLQDLLQQEGPGSENGLDIGLLWGQEQSSQVRFAGAKLGLWIQPLQGEFEVVKGDKISLGYSQRKGREVAIQNHDLTLEPGCRLFMMTDGILDQPGGAKGFGLGPRRLQEALKASANVPLSEMNGRLDLLLSNYSQSAPQRDDIAVVGFTIRRDRLQK